MAEGVEARPAVAQDEQLPEITARVADRLAPLLKDRNKARAVVRIVAEQVLEHYQGPLPHPEHLERFDQISPGAAGRIITMAENEQAHRHSMERREINYPYVGLGAGLLIGLMAIGGAIYLASLGATTIAGVLVGVPVIGCIGWFVDSRVSLGEGPPVLAAPAKRKRR